jgi:hypothetical protein
LAATLLGALGSAFGATHGAWADFDVAGGTTPDWLLRHTLEGSRFDLGRWTTKSPRQLSG